MNKSEIYQLLKSKNISYEVTEHKAVYNMAELSEVDIPYPDANAKNLFVRDDKKQHYYLITVKADKRVDLKAFRKAHGTRPLSFASEADLLEKLDLTPGSVSPFGLLNDDTAQVKFFIGKDFLSGNKLIGVHPNDNTATLWLDVNDLLNIISQHGTEYEFTEL